MMIKFYHTFCFFLFLLLLLCEFRLYAQEKPIKINGDTLSQVNVTANKPFIEHQAGKTILHVNGIARFAGSTVMDVLEKSPGIVVDKDDHIIMAGKPGVLILIDGKQTYMSSTDVSNLLRNMQSNEVESIELITSPSAKYDASGTAGIINIRTKKDKRYGANGNLTLGSGYGKTSKYNGGTNLNFRKDNINVFGNYNYSDYGNEGLLILNRTVTNENSTTTYLQNSLYNNRKTNHAYKMGVDYTLKKNHTIGLLFNGYTNGSGSADNPSFTNIHSVLADQHIANGSTQVHDNNQQKFRNAAYNLNYNGKLDTSGQELSIDFDYSIYHGKEIDYRSIDTLYQQDHGKYFVSNNTLAAISIKTIKADYVYPINKTMKMEAGVKSSWVTTDTDLQYLRSSNDELQFEEVTDYTNRFIYTEYINAAYLNLSKQYKRLGVQVGLRAEQTNSSADLVDRSNRTYHYINLFPGGSLTYKLTNDQDLSLSYTRRIDRPEYDNLTPSLHEIDNKTFRKGNEFLRPQYSNGIEFSHSFKHNFITTLSYTSTKDDIVGVTEQDNETAKTYVIYRNLNNDKVYALSVYSAFNFLKWWEFSNNLNLYYVSYDYTYDSNNFHEGQTSLNFNMNNTFTICRTITAETNVRYQSALIYGLNRIKSSTFTDVGLRKSFLDNQVSLKISVNDVFNGKMIRGTTVYQGINLSFDQKNESRIARLNLSYRFGNSKVKAARQRSAATDTESGRLRQ